MKREINRDKTLPAFSLEIGEFEILWERLLALFDREKEIYTSIEIKLSSESLEFNNIEELKEYTELRGRIKDFSFWISQGDRRISIRSNSFWGSHSIYA